MQVMLYALPTPFLFLRHVPRFLMLEVSLLALLGTLALPRTGGSPLAAAIFWNMRNGVRIPNLGPYSPAHASHILSSSASMCVSRSRIAAYRRTWYSLERAPVTGRIRFIDVSPGEEQRQALKMYNSLLAASEGKVLPQDDVLVQYVRRVVGRVLEGSQLGHLDGKVDKTNMGTPGDTWFDQASVNLEYGHGQKDREWRVLVIKEDDVANAAVVNGIPVYLPLIFMPNGRYRNCRCFHRIIAIVR